MQFSDEKHNICLQDVDVAKTIPEVPESAAISLALDAADVKFECKGLLE